MTAYGNAIVAQAAQAVIESYLETPDRHADTRRGSELDGVEEWLS